MTRIVLAIMLFVSAAWLASRANAAHRARPIGSASAVAINVVLAATLGLTAIAVLASDHTP